MKYVLQAGALAAIALLSACRSDEPKFFYQGADEVVLSTGQKEDSSVFLGQSADIAEVDGKRTGKPPEVHLAPGKHTVVTVMAVPGKQPAVACLWFTGEPGQHYRVKYRQSGFGKSLVNIWIQDQSGAQVGGLVDCGQYNAVYHP